MGDRTWARIWCRREDLSKLAEAGFESEYLPKEGDEAKPVAVLHLSEIAPYELNDLPTGVPFIFVHGPSDQGNYAPAEGAYDGQSMSIIEVGHTGQGYVVASNTESATRLENHINLKRKVSDLIGLSAEGTSGAA